MRPVDDQITISAEVSDDLILVDVGRKTADEDLSREALLVEDAIVRVDLRLSLL